MKFKKGDKVRVKKFELRPGSWNSDGKMDHLMGKVVKIKDTVGTDGYYIYDTAHDRIWILGEDQIEPINETIVIYRKDNKVIALDKCTGNKAEARCCPEDTFDFEIGAKLAFERLFEQKVDDEPTYYSGKIIFIKGRRSFETGRIYKIKDGYITDSIGDTYPLSAPFRDLEDVKDYFGGIENRKRKKGFSSDRLELIEVLDD